MATLLAVRQSLVAISRRYSRVSHEVEDLAHDIIVAALRRGPLDVEALLRTSRGAALRHGAFLARSAARRRARELGSLVDAIVDDGEASEEVGRTPLSTLSPALRTTLLLLVLGLEKAELRVALGVTDAALRKRFQALREQGPLARPHVPVAARGPAVPRLRRSQVELLRRLTTPRALAVSDPDGHGLIFAEVLTPGPSTATVQAKGSPCSTVSSRTSPSSS